MMGKYVVEYVVQLMLALCRVMAVNELDFPNPGIIGDASEYKVAPLYPLDTFSSSDLQSSAAAEGEKETICGKGESSTE